MKARVEIVCSGDSTSGLARRSLALASFDTTGVLEDRGACGDEASPKGERRRRGDGDRPWVRLTESLA